MFVKENDMNRMVKLIYSNWSVFIIIPIIVIFVAFIDPWRSLDEPFVSFFTAFAGSFKLARGPINDLTNKHPKIYVPSTENDGSNYADTAKIYANLYANNDRDESIEDLNVTNQDMKRGSIILIGSMEDNKTMEELNEFLPIKAYRNSIIAGEYTFEDESLCTAYVIRNPYNSRQYLGVYSGSNPESLEIAINNSIPYTDVDFVITNKTVTKTLMTILNGGFYYAKGYFDNKNKKVWAFPKLPILKAIITKRKIVNSNKIQLSIQMESSDETRMMSVDRYLETNDIEYVGLGFSYTMKYSLNGNKIMIVEVFKNSPSEEAGIKSGYELIKINDSLITNEDDLSKLSSVKGKIGDKIKLTFRDDNDEKEFFLTFKKLTRKITKEKFAVEVLKERLVGKITINQEIGSNVDEIIFEATDINGNSVMKKIVCND